MPLPKVFRDMTKPKVDASIASVEAQINAVMRGATNVITCPFCGKQNREENEALCCADFGAVVNAILRKQAQQELIDQAHRISDAIN